MQAVILAAGRGSRMRRLTENQPKPLLQVGGRALLDYTFDALPEGVDEVVLVIGYLGGMIRERYGTEYHGKKVTYVVQEALNGTASALWLTKEILRDRFMVLMADDLYGRADLGRAATMNQKNWGIGVCREGYLEEGGKVLMGEDGRIEDIVEGEHDGSAGLVCTNLFVLDTRFFSELPFEKDLDSPEYGLAKNVLAGSAALNVPIEPLEATFWLKITAPHDIEMAEQLLKSGARL